MGEFKKCHHTHKKLSHIMSLLSVLAVVVAVVVVVYDNSSLMIESFEGVKLHSWIS